MAELGSGSVQNWTTDVRAVLGEAHDVVQAAKASGNSAQDPTRLAGLRTRYDRGTAFGRTHHRHRDWHVGNHPDTPWPGG